MMLSIEQIKAERDQFREFHDTLLQLLKDKHGHDWTEWNGSMADKATDIYEQLESTWELWNEAEKETQVLLK